MRVAFHTDNGIAAPAPEIAETVRAAARALEDAGVTVVEARPPVLEQAHELILGLFGADGGASLQTLLHLSGTTETHALMTHLLEILQRQPLSTPEFGGLLFQLDIYRGAMLSFMKDYDAILCPPCARTAMPHGTTFDEENLFAFSYTMTYNLTGWPVWSSAPEPPRKDCPSACRSWPSRGARTWRSRSRARLSRRSAAMRPTV